MVASAVLATSPQRESPAQQVRRELPRSTPASAPMSSSRLSRLGDTLSTVLYPRKRARVAAPGASPAWQQREPPLASVRETARLAPQHPAVTVTTLPVPVDVVEGSIARLRWVALGLALASLAVYFIGKYYGTWIDPDAAPASYGIACWLAAFGGVGMFALAHSRRVSPYRLLDAALIFQVVGGLLISLAENAVPRLPGEVIRGQPSLAVWIAFFVLAVPASVGKSTLAAIVTACMGPLGLGVQVILGNVPTPPPLQWVLPFAVSFFMAAAASALARFVYDLRVEVVQARQLGSYHLVELLGRGGMGEVWRARHRLLAREAAIKLIRTDALQAASPAHLVAAQRRFEREAQVTSGLRSPHTVTLYDYGVAEDGRFYYVMELLEGMNLEMLVQRFGPVPASRAVCILLQICDSLGEAHRHGLIHRDIKPANVLLCRLGIHHDFVKVLDFGLVRRAAGDGSHVSVSHVAAGTPAFLAPEAAEAKLDLDARVDIYSLGCLAYWLLTGRIVFEEASSMATILAHVRQQPVPPSQRTENEIPAALENLIMQCLEKDPVRRPQSVEIIAEHLGACAVGETWDARRAEHWWRTHQPEGVEQK